MTKIIIRERGFLIKSQHFSEEVFPDVMSTQQRIHAQKPLFYTFEHKEFFSLLKIILKKSLTIYIAM